MGRMLFPSSGQQLGLLALLGDQGNCLFVERDKSFTAKPAPLEGDQAVGEISTGIEHGHSGLDGRASHHDIAGIQQRIKCSGNILLCKTVDTPEDPHELAQARQRNRYELGIFEQPVCGLGLLLLVAYHSANKDVRIDGDLHSWPAQPAAAASLISSRVAIFLVLPASKPRKASIFPAGRAALSITRPSASFCSSIFSPGRMPRCCNTSLRKVTCPRPVTVNMAMTN